MRRSFVVILGLSIVGVFVLCAGQVWMLQVPAYLAFGWIASVADAVPRVAVNGAGVASFAVAIALAAWLAQGLGGWLWNDATNGRRWRWKWTAIGLTTVLLMFIAGMTATGVTHQTAWLIAGQERLVEWSWRRHPAMRHRCADNLEQIGQAIASYAKENNGYRPRDVGDLARIAAADELPPGEFMCPAIDPSDRPDWPGTRPSDWVPAIETFCSYVYCVPPILGPRGVKRVAMYEPLANHVDGLNVLYDDGSGEWIDHDRATHWLATTRPSASP